MSWLTVHFDEQTIAALDAAAAEITAHYPTLKVSREDIVRSLVARGIEAPRKSAPQPIAPVVAPPQPAPVEDRRPITSTDQPHGLRTLDWLLRGVGTVPSPRAIAVGVASRRKDTEVSR